ncbi:MAG TPA: hypothetical protein VF176_03335 [Solirubrobacterales bacterium]
MSEDSWPKVGASMGIAAAVLLILSFVFGPSDAPPGFDDSAEDVRAFILDNRSAIQAAVAFQFAAIVSVAWFLGSVFYRLRGAEPAARLSVVALVGGVLIGVGGMIGSAATAAAAYHVESLDPGVVLALWDMSIFGYTFFLVGLTVLTAATGALGIRAGKKAVPDLLCFYSVGLAIYSFVVGVVTSFSETGAFSPSDGVLGLIAFLGFIVWLLAMGATLVREPRPIRSGG